MVVMAESKIVFVVSTQDHKTARQNAPDLVSCYFVRLAGANGRGNHLALEIH
jgi:hypothetical protein